MLISQCQCHLGEWCTSARNTGLRNSKTQVCATSPATDSRVTTPLKRIKQNKTCTLTAFLNLFLQPHTLMAFLQRQSGQISIPSERCHKALRTPQLSSLPLKDPVQTSVASRTASVAKVPFPQSHGQDLNSGPCCFY